MQVRFSEDTACVPDIVVVRERGWTPETSCFPHTHVELAVEVCEDGSRGLDGGLKPAIYAAGGIPSFWRIDIDGRVVVHTYRLDSGVYEDTLQVHEPWPLAVPIKKLTPRYL